MSTSPSKLKSAVEQVGELAGERLDQGRNAIKNTGGMAYLFADTLAWFVRCLVRPGVRFSGHNLVQQMVRVGVNSIGIVVIVQIFIGGILALQMAPTLQSYGQLEQVGTIVAISIVRELGPLITAIVLSGFAGASIAAEIAAMTESEEIKALRSHAMNPIRYLVLPRFLASAVMIVGLTVIADIVGLLGGFITAWSVLGLAPSAYLEATQNALVTRDFITGLSKACVFGMVISMIACYEGLNVSGGAVGVGKATTATVVKSIVAIIGIDAAFTFVFYTFGW